jgi:hypothetical protein
MISFSLVYVQRRLLAGITLISTFDHKQSKSILLPNNGDSAFIDKNHKKASD